MSEAERSEIDVKQAILIAKRPVGDLFSIDQVKNIGLEEVMFDEAESLWNITIGFSRPWETAPVDGGISMNHLFTESLPRTYKVVSISAADGKVQRVVIRTV